MVIGNAVTQLNDGGFQFKVFPPEVVAQEQCAQTGKDSEATILCFETPSGNVYLNIVMKYLQRRSRERSAVPVGLSAFRWKVWPRLRSSALVDPLCGIPRRA